MEALDLLKQIQKQIDDNGELTSPVMYDPKKLEGKVSIGVMQKTNKGLIKRFIITVDDTTKQPFL